MHGRKNIKFKMCVQHFIHKAISPSSFIDPRFYIIHKKTHLAFNSQPLCYDRTQQKTV
jgi:hypothetical protein